MSAALLGARRVNLWPSGVEELMDGSSRLGRKWTTDHMVECRLERSMIMKRPLITGVTT